MPKSIGITLRPRTGFNEEDVREFLKFYKYSSYIGCYAVLEKEDDQRHLHAIFWFQHDVGLGNFNSNHWRKKFKRKWELRDDSIWSLYDHRTRENKGAWTSRHMFNDDWYHNYLLLQLKDDGTPKGDPVKVLVDDVPTLEVRMSCYSDVEKKRVFKGDEYYIKLKKLWDSWSTSPEISKEKIKRFFIDAQYGSRTIRVISQQKILNEKMKCFLGWLTKGKSMFRVWSKIPWKENFSDDESSVQLPPEDDPDEPEQDFHTRCNRHPSIVSNPKIVPLCEYPVIKNSCDNCLCHQFGYTDLKYVKMLKKKPHWYSS